MSSPEELASLKRIENLLRSLARAALAPTLEAVLADRQQRYLYENTGKLPVKQLAKKTGFGTGTISRLWQQWETAGLLVKDGKQYRRLLE